MDALCGQLILNVVNYLKDAINTYQQQYICLLFNVEFKHSKAKQHPHFAFLQKLSKGITYSRYAPFKEIFGFTTQN